MSRPRAATRPLREIARAADWPLVGALRGALVGALLPSIFGAGLVAYRYWESTNEAPYQGQTSVSYQNTAGGAWGYAVISLVYVGVLLTVASGGAATVGFVVGGSIGLACAAIDALLGRRVPPFVVAPLVMAGVAAATYPALVDRTLFGLDPDPWLLLVAGPMLLGLGSLCVLPLRRVDRAANSDLRIESVA